MIHPNLIANYFIGKSFATGELITPMKVVKLVYVSHGWYLALADKPLISEVQAWRYGPVIPCVYYAFRHYGGNGITSLTNKYTGEFPEDKEKVLFPFLDKIWKEYGRFSAIKLSTITHLKGTPWSLTWEKAGGKHHAVIPNDLIKEHYKEKISER